MSEERASDVPVVDISAYYGGDAEAKARLAREVDRVCQEIGFLVITGHKVPQDVIDNCAAVSRAFFDLPVEWKIATIPEPYRPRGYAPMSQESLAGLDGQVTPPDLKEAYDMGPFRVGEGPYFADKEVQFAENVWPAALPEMQTAWEAYYDAVEDFAADMMRLMAVALDLPESHFDPILEKGKGISLLRVLNYPDQSEPPKPGQMRAGEHTDFGTITVVNTEDKPGGLEVRRKDGTWARVPMVPGALVINLGDLMARWTNDRWVSTMHRVNNPPPDAEGSTRRQSIVLFHGPTADIEIETIPSCVTPENPAKYEPISYRDYLMMRFAAKTEYAS